MSTKLGLLSDDEFRWIEGEIEKHECVILKIEYGRWVSGIGIPGSALGRISDSVAVTSYGTSTCLAVSPRKVISTRTFWLFAFSV